MNGLDYRNELTMGPQWEAGFPMVSTSSGNDFFS